MTAAGLLGRKTGRGFYDYRDTGEHRHGGTRLSDEHELLRQTVRELAEAKIAPAAADVDASGRFPQEALDALTGARLHAAHIPEGYGGEGADALAAVIIIEEVARACASSSLIPAVNKLGTVPLLLSGSEELKRQVPAAGGPRARRCSPTRCPRRGRLGRRRHEDPGGPRRRLAGC